MGEWRECALGEVLSIKHGFPFKTEYHSEELSGKPIVVNIGNFKYSGGFRFESTKLREYRGEFPDDYILKPGEILLIMTCQTEGGEILGIPGVVPDDGRVYLHNQRLGKVVITKTDSVNGAFLYWYFLNPDFNQQLFSSATGSKILHTAPTRIENCQVLLPPLAEQKAIAAVLSSLDDKIDLLHRQNKTLEALAETLFRQWFVEEAQEDWAEVPLDEIADFLNGLACQKYPPKNEIDKLPVLKIRELKSGISELSDWATSEINQDYLVRSGDIVFSWSGSLLVKIWDGMDCVLNQHLFKVSSNQFPKWFVYQWTNFHLAKFIEIAESKATTMGHIKRGDLSTSMVLVPAKELIYHMDATMGPLLDKCILNNSQIAKLCKLRDTLLPKLMSGEVRVDP